MSARLFGAAEAVDLGLLARAVPADELDAAIEAEVVPYLSCAPGAVAAAKKLAQDLGGIATPEAVKMSIDALAARWETEEAAEGIAAFFDKRKAAWVV
jgi:methylglutaconyl-CoA hydratase